MAGPSPFCATQRTSQGEAKFLINAHPYEPSIPKGRDGMVTRVFGAAKLRVSHGAKQNSRTPNHASKSRISKRPNLGLVSIR